MVKIKINLPIDLTFLSGLLYEGLLYSIKNSQAKRVSTFEIDLPDDFLQKAYSSLSDENLEEVRLPLAGKNDNVSLNKLCKELNISIEKKSFRNLLIGIKNQSTRLQVKTQVNLQLKSYGQDILLDLEGKKGNNFTFQIFKMDRYTGLSSLEKRYTSSQLTTRLSFEATIISLLGLASSYVSGYGNDHYFLFFSPDEVSFLLSHVDSSLINKYFRIKDSVNSSVKEYISSAVCSEVLLFELMLNTKLQELVLKEGLDKVSLILFRVAIEGQTYKVYEILPVTVYKNSVFSEKLETYTRNPQKFIQYVEKILDPERSVIIKALSSMSGEGRLFVEANNVLLAVQSLYKFVTFGSIESLYISIRELLNAYEKTKNEPRSKNRSKEYLELAKDFSYFLA
jgi:hypothetical protein